MNVSVSYLACSMLLILKSMHMPLFSELKYKVDLLAKVNALKHTVHPDTTNAERSSKRGYKQLSPIINIHFILTIQICTLANGQ